MDDGRMDDGGVDGVIRPPRAYAFPLATFHVCVLVLGIVAIGYPDVTFEGLNAALGLAIFGVLWGASYYGTAWALRDVRVHALGVAVRRGIGGGMRSALIVLVVALLPFVLGAVVFDPLAGLFILAVYGTIGAVVAALVGAVVGLAFSLLDWSILTIAGMDGAWDPPEEWA